MAVELIIFGLVLGAAILCYFIGLSFKLPHLFIFGCVFLLGASAVLWGFGGLVIGHYYDVDGVFASTIVPMSNLGLVMLSYLFVGVGLVSLFVINFGGLKETRSPSPFHY